MRRVKARRVQELRRVPFEEWFPAEGQPGVEYFHTALHEDFYRAYVDTNVPFGSHRVCSLENIVSVVGEQIRPHLTYLPRLADLIGRSGSYVGTPRQVTNDKAREVLRIPRQVVRLHKLCFP